MFEPSSRSGCDGRDYPPTQPLFCVTPVHVSGGSGEVIVTFGGLRFFTFIQSKKASSEPAFKNRLLLESSAMLESCRVETPPQSPGCQSVSIRQARQKKEVSGRNHMGGTTNPMGYVPHALTVLVSLTSRVRLQQLGGWASTISPPFKFLKFLFKEGDSSCFHCNFSTCMLRWVMHRLVSEYTRAGGFHGCCAAGSGI